MGALAYQVVAFPTLSNPIQCGVRKRLINGLGTTWSITKSGGNQFHGTLYEYFRNDVLDTTNDVVQPQAGVTLAKSELRQNQFGGSLGGRVVKNKTFFFGDYEGFRQVRAKPRPLTHPRTRN